MKKILIILISLFICNVAVADNWLKLPKDVVSGWKFFKSMPKMFKDHGMQIVNKKDGYPKIAIKNIRQRISMIS